MANNNDNDNDNGFLDRLVETVHNNPDGFTVRYDLAPLPETFTGFVVGGAVPAYKAPVDDIDTDALADWVTTTQEKWVPYLGGWVHEGVLYLDGVTRHATAAEAYAEAEARGELAFGVYQHGVYTETRYMSA